MPLLKRMYVRKCSSTSRRNYYPSSNYCSIFNSKLRKKSLLSLLKFFRDDSKMHRLVLRDRKKKFCRATSTPMGEEGQEEGHFEITIA